MGKSKIIYGGETLIDLTGDSVAANKMLAGATAHGADGEPITGTISSQEAQSITPGTSDRIIAAGRYLSGVQTIKGDSNLKPENIIKGVSIFNVVGTADISGGTGGAEDKTACDLYIQDHTYLNPSVQYTNETGETIVEHLSTTGTSVISFVGAVVEVFLPDGPEFFLLNFEGASCKYFGPLPLDLGAVSLAVFEITAESARIEVETDGGI